MKKSIISILSWSLSIFALIAIISLAFYDRPQRSSQEAVSPTADEQVKQEADLQTLQEHLKQLGIPINSLSITNQSPLEIKVVIEGSGDGKTHNSSDMWNGFLSDREINLADLDWGLNIYSYNLVLVYADGQTADEGTTFLHPEWLSKLQTPAPTSSVDNGKTMGIVEDNLDLHGLKLSSVEVPASYTFIDNSQLLELNLTTTTDDNKTASDQINQFIGDLRALLYKAINARYGTCIHIVHVIIRDASNNLLVDYLEDIATGRQYSWNAQNIDAGWYPIPAPIMSPRPQDMYTPTISFTFTPMKFITPPAPTLQPSAYPEPLPYTPPPAYPYP